MFPVYRPCSISQADNQLLTMIDNASFCIWGPNDNPGEQQWILERRGSDKVVLRNLKYNKYAGVSGMLEPSAPVSPTIQPIELTMESIETDQYRLWAETENGRLFLGYSPIPSATLPPRLEWVSESMMHNAWKFQHVC
ncbi:hypothetical protein RSOLAG1IB_08214 [Rhizoctonia solani AG-1 IB]|uniref:Ricin B lectin domain-containing protein n=1 Tax=Thanatephorus cucumeris (strain AG1-IB / isolate 7/3/14) TaxID=1108050 RepID=A0A0B7FFW6_THACB|nr:hypothetical protein RSOLAG1IB_08214 [Rhizoctonia solani AG-1 IB]